MMLLMTNFLTKRLGKLKFASIGTHLDITYVVSMVAKFSFTSKKIHYNVIHKISNT